MRVKKELMINKDVDDKLAKERVREKRIKNKKRLRKEMGIAPKEQDQADQGSESMDKSESEGKSMSDSQSVGSEDERSDDESGARQASNSYGSNEGQSSEEDYESIEEIPLRKRQKTSGNQTGRIKMTAEQKAMQMLSGKTSSDFTELLFL